MMTSSMLRCGTLGAKAAEVSGQAAGAGIPLVVSPDRRYVAGMGSAKAQGRNGRCGDGDLGRGEGAAAASLLKLKKNLSLFLLGPAFFCQSADFSPDLTLFAFADGSTKKAHLWTGRGVGGVGLREDA